MEGNKYFNGVVEAGKYKGEVFEIIIGEGSHNTTVLVNSADISNSINKIELEMDAHKTGLWTAVFTFVRE